MPDRMGLILLVENLDQYEAAVRSVKSANDQVAGSMQSLETGAKKVKAGSVAASVGVKKFAGMLALANVAAAFAVKTITQVVGSFKQLIVSATMLTARVRVLTAALRTSARQAGLNVKETEDLVQAIHKKGVTYQAATELVLSLIDAEADLDKALALVTTAQNAASRAGGSTSETIQRMLWAMQTAQPYLLRSVYLTVDFAAAEDELAASLNTTREALTEGQQMQARMNAIIKAGVPLLGTYEAAMGEGAKVAGSLRDRIKDILTVMGEITYPAWSEMIIAAYDRAKKLLKYLEDNKETLENMGKLLAEGVKAAIIQVDLLIKAIGKIPGGVKTAGVSLASLFIGQKEAEERSKHLNEYFFKSLALLGAGLSLITVVIKTTVVELNELGKALVLLTPPGWLVVGFKALRGDLEDVKKTFREGFDPGGFRDAEAPIKAFEETLLKLSIGFGLVEDASKDATDEIVDGLGKVDDAASKVTDEMKDMAEALTDLRLDLQRELVDDLIDEERRLLRQEINLARRREDIARKTAMSIAAAYADAAAARADLAADAAEDRAEFERDVTEEWADLEEDAARDREAMDRDYADRRIDIEIATRRRLQDIQRQFEMSVQDAARTRDAFALVQAQRRAASDRGAALRGRDEQLADAKTAHERQERDFAISLAEQREDLRESLAEQEADLVASLAERQQDIERQLQAQLASIEEANRLEAEDRARQMARGREDMALQAKWEQEDRTRRLMRQLQDMEIQYGDLGDITAEGLMEQVKDWADTYGPEGAAAQIVTDFSTIVQEQAQLWAEAIEKATRSLDVFDSKLTRPRSLDLKLNIPPELELHSPKLGLQIGLENLEKMLARQPISAFMAGGLPAAPSTFSRTETFAKTQSAHSIDVNMPDMDTVIARQMIGMFRQVLTAQ